MHRIFQKYRLSSNDQQHRVGLGEHVILARQVIAISKQQLYLSFWQTV